MSGDGSLSLFLGLAAGICLIPLMSGRYRMAPNIVAGILLAVAAVIGIHDWSNLASVTGDGASTFFNIGVAWGLPLMTFSAILGVALSLYSIKEQHARS